MSDDENSLFKKKRIGYGLSPRGIGGWLVVLVIIAMTLGLRFALRHL